MESVVSSPIPSFIYFQAPLFFHNPSILAYEIESFNIIFVFLKEKHREPEWFPVKRKYIAMYGRITMFVYCACVLYMRSKRSSRSN